MELNIVVGILQGIIVTLPFFELKYEQNSIAFSPNNCKRV